MPKVLKILTLPKKGKDLRQIAQAVDLSTISTKQFTCLVDDMTRTMILKDGIGLAAPQIGQKIRVVLINTKEGPVCMINPKIIKKSLLKEIGEEGCLSVPGVYGNVKRHKSIVCDFTDINAINKKMEASGLMARVVQHELDHLDGVLFIDKMEPETKKK